MVSTNIKTAVKGLVVGSSMLLPGVSGGTTAIILGIYDKLIHAVSTLTKDPKKNLVFLGIFCLGAAIGIVSFARLMLWVVETWKFPAMFFFFGAIVGSVPMLFRQSRATKLNVWLILAGVLGFCLVLSLPFLPKPEAGFSGNAIVHILMLFGTGVIIAIALILPGISTSHMLLVLGMYETTLEAIKGMNFGFLVPIALGGLVGVLLLTSLIDKALSKAPQLSYFTIIGFVLGSVASVFPGFPTGLQIPVCVLTFAAGFVILYFVSRFSKD